MARFMRLDVTCSILEAGLVPLFYHGEIEVAIESVKNKQIVTAASLFLKNCILSSPFFSVL